MTFVGFFFNFLKIFYAQFNVMNKVGLSRSSDKTQNGEGLGGELRDGVN